MIIGVGTDIVSVDRIQKLIDKYGSKFLERCFTSKEIQQCLARGKDRQTSSFAKIYAGKEAVLKACGTGMRETISWHDIETSHDDLGKPLVEIKGGVKDTVFARIKKISPQLFDPLQITMELSLSDEDAYAVAFAVLTYDGP